MFIQQVFCCLNARLFISLSSTILDAMIRRECSEQQTWTWIFENRRIGTITACTYVHSSPRMDVDVWESDAELCVSVSAWVWVCVCVSVFVSVCEDVLHVLHCIDFKCIHSIVHDVQTQVMWMYSKKNFCILIDRQKIKMGARSISQGPQCLSKCFFLQ
jgi:hypothetical protein